MITFTKDVADDMLDMFGCSVDANGVIVRGVNPVLGLDGRPVRRVDFAGFVKKNGEMRLITTNIVDLIELSDMLKVGEVK